MIQFINTQSVENKIDGLVVVFTGLVSSGDIVLVSFGQSLANQEQTLAYDFQKEFVALIFGKGEAETVK